MGLASLPTVAGPGAEWGTQLLQEVPVLQARLHLITSGWETDPRRPTTLSLSYNMPSLPPAYSHNHSADAYPMSAVIHLVLTLPLPSVLTVGFYKREFVSNPCCCDGSLKQKLTELQNFLVLEVVLGNAINDNPMQ